MKQEARLGLLGRRTGGWIRGYASIKHGGPSGNYDITIGFLNLFFLGNVTLPLELWHYHGNYDITIGLWHSRGSRPLNSQSRWNQDCGHSSPELLKTALKYWSAPMHLERNRTSLWNRNGTNMAVCQNLVPLVNIKMVSIGIDPYPYVYNMYKSHHKTTLQGCQHQIEVVASN